MTAGGGRYPKNLFESYCIPKKCEQKYSVYDFCSLHSAHGMQHARKAATNQQSGMQIYLFHASNATPTYLAPSPAPTTMRRYSNVHAATRAKALLTCCALCCRCKHARCPQQPRRRRHPTAPVIHQRGFPHRRLGCLRLTRISLLPALRIPLIPLIAIVRLPACCIRGSALIGAAAEAACAATHVVVAAFPAARAAATALPAALAAMTVLAWLVRCVLTLCSKRMCEGA